VWLLAADPSFLRPSPPPSPRSGFQLEPPGRGAAINVLQVGRAGHVCQRSAEHRPRRPGPTHAHPQTLTRCLPACRHVPCAQVLFSFLLDVFVLRHTPSVLSVLGSCLVASGVLFVAISPSPRSRRAPASVAAVAAASSPAASGAAPPRSVFRWARRKPSAAAAAVAVPGAADGGEAKAAEGIASVIVASGGGGSLNALLRPLLEPEPTTDEMEEATGSSRHPSMGDEEEGEEEEEDWEEPADEAAADDANERV
jgi:hypothetical protein